tara:strand:- start:150 stop:920 length:771 start_codon:yes stop_codon:yes gene_type:complete
MAFYDIDLKEQVKNKHKLWDIEKLVQFSKLTYRLKDMENMVGRSGYGIDCGLRSMYLQFHYDLSDRKMEECLRFDMAFRWFCGFTAFEETPDHSYFCRFRAAVGTKRIGSIFKAIVKRSKKAGIIRSVFQFADATAIITKTTTWAERDQAIKKGEEELNNRNIKKYSADPQARFGCNGKWGCTSAAIMKHNMNGKNKDLDRWRSGIRAPFEGVFSKFEKRARYRGLAKVQMQLFMDAMVWNVKRLVKINQLTPISI